jgi:hypothetical protein
MVSDRSMRLLSREPREVVEEEEGRELVEEEVGRELVEVVVGGELVEEVVEVVVGGELVEEVVEVVVGRKLVVEVVVGRELDEDEVVEGGTADDEPGGVVETTREVETGPAVEEGPAVEMGGAVVTTGGDEATAGGDEATTRDDELTTVGEGDLGGAPEAGGDAGPWEGGAVAARVDMGFADEERKRRRGEEKEKWRVENDSGARRCQRTSRSRGRSGSTLWQCQVKGRKWEEETLKEESGLASKDEINGSRTQPHFHL